MCGIAGMVSFARDLSGEHDLAKRMSDALALRGPDQEGHWFDRHALLAFRRNAVVDLAGGRQPMVAEDAGGTHAVLNYTGEIFNAPELRAELTSRGHSFRTHSDTEVVLRAYVEWGAECADRLRGMFAFAVWDARLSQMVLIRDRIGIYPLFYTEIEEGFLFGSEPKALFASGKCEPVVDEDGLRELFGFTPTPGYSVFRGVREVIPGEVVTFGRNGLQRRLYWRLPGREHTDDFKTTVRTVRELVEDAVRSQLVADVPLSAMLSGGMDSSTICALVRSFGGRRSSVPGEKPLGGDLSTYSMEFAYHLKSFRPDDVYPSTDSPFANLMSKHLGTSHTELLVTSEDVTNLDHQRAVLAAMDRPAARLDMYVALRRLSSLVRESSTVTLSGDGSDELFGGYAWFHNQRAVNSSTFPWFGSPTYNFEMLSGLVDRQLVKELDLPSYGADRYAEARAEVPVVDGESAQDRRMREFVYLHMTRYLRVIIDRKDRMGASVALEGRVPFCDHHLVEYVFNVPWEMKAAGGREKGLLRAAIHDLLPAEISERRKSNFPNIQDPAYCGYLLDQVRELFSDRSSPVLGLLDSARLESVFTDAPDALTPGVNRLSLETAIMLDLWVREQGVTIAV
jgi:asparagine synthase (glutamine-hydrolysing)